MVVWVSRAGVTGGVEEPHRGVASSWATLGAEEAGCGPFLETPSLSSCSSSLADSASPLQLPWRPGLPPVLTAPMAVVLVSAGKHCR